MTIDTSEQRREIAAFYEQVIRDLDRRLARIELSRQDTYSSVPAWRHLTERRAYFLRLRAESCDCGSAASECGPGRNETSEARRGSGPARSGGWLAIARAGWRHRMESMWAGRPTPRAG
jgi:hypothetical protein